MSLSRTSLSQSETSSPQHWHEQEWRDLICPICHRTTYGPEGNTFCGWHVGTLGNVLMESLLTAKGPERCEPIRNVEARAELGAGRGCVRHRDDS